MLKVTYHGHSCFTLDSGEHRVVIDPWFTGNPLADRPVDEVKADAVLVSHGHYDHLGDAIPISKRCGAPIIGVAELCAYCASKGAKVYSMHIGGSHQFPFGRVKLTPAWHGSAVMNAEGNWYTGTPCGFLVEMGGKIVYHSGDTGLFGDMELIGRWKRVDLALLPIGDNYVMGPDDAVEAVEMLQPTAVVPMHYDTFDAIKQDAQAFCDAVSARDLAKPVLLKPGQSYTI